MARVLCTMLLVVGMWLAYAAPLTAAEAGSSNTGAVLDIMPDMQYRFESVDELIGEKKWDRVLERLADVSEEAGETVWSNDNNDNKVYMSVAQYVRRRIMELPPEGLAFYRMRYDGEALALLQEGIQKRDAAILDQIAEKYPASSYAAAGLDAAASVLIDAGRYNAAAMRLERMLARPKATDDTVIHPQFRSIALAKLGFCYAKLGDTTVLGKLNERLKQSGFRGDLKVGDGQNVMAFLRATLDRGAREVLPQVKATSWPTPGGHASHRLAMGDLGADLSLRWTVKVGEEEEAREVEKKPQPVRGRMPYTPPPVKMQASPWPVTDEEGVVYINTGKALYALDHITGRERWVTKPRTMEAPAAPQQGRLVFFNNMQNRHLTFWNQWAGATSASLGGGRVYATEIMSVGGQMLLSLSAFNTANGERVWSFGQTAEGGEFDEEAFFPWAPRYFDGRVIGVAVHRDQTFIVALDAATGSLVWKVFLAADPVLAANMNMRQMLRPDMGRPVVISDGIVYATTGMGVVAAVEAQTGQLRWLSTYPRTGIKVNEIKQAWGVHTTYQREPSWDAGFPVIDGGRLYVTAWDATELLVFDCATGKLIKKIGRGDFTHFAGVRDGVAYLVGQETAAVDVHTGWMHWMAPTPFEIQGMPVLTESALVIPTAGAICSLTLADPVVREIKPVAGGNDKLVMGNLVSHEGRMIAANIAYVSGYFSYGETYTYLTSLIEAAPDVVKELLDRADLSYLHAGTLADTSERAATLHKALTDLQLAERRLAKQRPADKVLARRLKRSMFEARMKLAQDEANKAVAHIDHAQPYIFEERAKFRWHLGRGTALAAEGRYQDAVDVYLNIVQNMAGKQLSDDETTTPVDVIAQARIGELVAQKGLGVYARVDAALKPEFDKFVEAKDFDGLRDFQIRHPHSSLADNSFYEMARIITPQPHGELRAQVLLQSIIYRYPHSELLGEAYAMLLRNCASSRRYRLGALMLQDIIKRHPDVMVTWEGREWRGTEWAAAMLKRPDYTEALAVLSRPLPVLGEPLKMAWQSGKGVEVLAQVVSEENSFDRGIGLAMDMKIERHAAGGWMGYRGSYIRAFSTATGETLWQTKVAVDTSMGSIEQGGSIWNRHQQHHLVLCSGGIVALAHPEGIQALDLLTGRKLWSVSWKRPAGSQPTLWFGNIQMDYRIRNAINPRPTFASDAGRFFYLIPDGTLVSLDAATGQELWRVKQPGFASGTIGLMGDVVVAASVNPGEIHAYNIMDGRRLYRKPLPGTFQQPPAFDKARGRVLVSDGLSLSSHNVADFRRVWHAKDISTVNNQQLWAVNVLADGHVSVMCYNRSGNPLVYGHHLTMLDGDTGKRKWIYCATRQKREANGSSDSTNPNGTPLFTRNRVLIPVMERIMRREGQRFTSLTDQATHALDIASGKKMGEYRIKLPAPPKVKNRPAFRQVQLMAAASAAEHLVTLTSENNAGRAQNALRVTNVTNGSEVLVDDLPALMGGHFHYVRQGLSLTLTPDGRLLVPTGDGIRCYAASEGGDKQ